MPNCDFKIVASIDYNCEHPVTKGLKPIGWIGNYDDLDLSNSTRDSNNPNLFTKIALKTGAKLFTIYQAGKAPFSGTIKEFQEGTYRNTWNKTVPFVILDNGADITENIVDPLANGKFFMVIENTYQGAALDNAFEIVGLETGMAMSAGTDEKWNEDFGGGWSLTMVETNAPSSGIYLLDTDVATTRAGLAALVSGSSWPS